MIFPGEVCEPLAISPLPVGGLSSGVLLRWGFGVSTGTEVQYARLQLLLYLQLHQHFTEVCAMHCAEAVDISVFCLFNYSPMRQMLFLSLHWSREFALGHTRRGSLAPACAASHSALCVEVQGPEQEGKEPDTRELLPEATCNTGPLESYRFSDHHLKINSVVLVRA